MESETFADMFSVAESSNTSGKLIEGSSADHPIKLEGVSPSDFECLLTLLYARYCTQQRPHLAISLVLPAFRLAHMWNFKELRAYLIPLLEEWLNDVDKTFYAHEFNIQQWVVPAYIRLCSRTEPLNSEEAEKIGFKGAMLIFRLREDRHLVPCPSCRGRDTRVPQLYCGGYGGSRNVVGNDLTRCSLRRKSWLGRRVDKSFPNVLSGEIPQRLVTLGAIVFPWKDWVRP
ncbi:hypothetical protein RSAG8_10049, partial [Rhizoctonia solani AG-8 WAC10335]